MAPRSGRAVPLAARLTIAVHSPSMLRHGMVGAEHAVTCAFAPTPFLVRSQ